MPGVYVNGACHWVASGRQNMIVLFDVHKEKFSAIMAPASIVNKSFGSFGGGCLILFVSDESLCLVDRLHGGDGIIDIWLMKEYGEAESWMKQFRIKLSHITYPVDVVDVFFSPLSFLERPIASRKNGESLWRADEGLLVSYDPATEKIKNLGIHNAHTFFSYAFHVHTYKVSLMLLGKRTDYFAGDTCKDSSNLCMREAKGGREKFLKADAKRGLQIVHVKNESNEAAHDKTEEQVDTGTSIGRSKFLEGVGITWKFSILLGNPPLANIEALVLQATLS
ncbi:F-box/kelch-repeat protein At3g06240-like [Lycium ferocissimum]|uniref:F-box/kelch-repeat protein At3g06240-like n=1 Tax=Lycium ferocissimum TaxID=112874 RepID=UPI0028150C1B|nr:F-box/kelch-repeat protein At3g06240-like [Lycium ferocissimum]